MLLQVELRLLQLKFSFLDFILRIGHAFFSLFFDLVNDGHRQVYVLFLLGN